MITDNTTVIESYKSPVRSIAALVTVKDADGNTAHTWTNKDAIKSITLERVGEDGKFFGFGICQKANVQIIDQQREISLATSQYLDMQFDGISFAPCMHITETHRDELNNELSITAYDAIYKATAHTVGELVVEEPVTIEAYANKAAELLGFTLLIIGNNTPFATSYDEGANLDGTETIRALLDDIAEATQTIYYANTNGQLVFKQLDKDGAAVYTIDKEQYYSMDSGTNRRLAKIVHATELGDNVSAELAVSGSTQYIRDSAFFEMREDVAALVDAALANIGGITINQFECEWRGNPVIEIGDKLDLVTKDNATACTYLLNDTINYDGAYSQSTSWKYADDTSDTEDNPTSLGDALNKTYARVDKINKEINIVASETETNANNIAALQMNTESIAASVKKVEENTTATFDGVNEELATLTNKVEAAMTAEGVKLSIQEELANGVDRVYTSTGFAFDADGLRISKTGSEMQSLLDEDGLSVFRDDTEVLTADNTGVNGINMTVRQYLIVGGSRFEAYGSGRTGCFWIGG